jgi:hypothetical protein
VLPILIPGGLDVNESRAGTKVKGKVRSSAAGLIVTHKSTGARSAPVPNACEPAHALPDCVVQPSWNAFCEFDARKMNIGEFLRRRRHWDLPVEWSDETLSARLMFQRMSPFPFNGYGGFCGTRPVEMKNIGYIDEVKESFIPSIT